MPFEKAPCLPYEMKQVEDFIWTEPSNALHLIAIRHPQATDVPAGPLVIEQHLGSYRLAMPWRRCLTDNEQSWLGN
jgi:hypothetical protein